ncbi:hypothetical protein ACI2JR_10955 [Klebsiella sp. NPDC088457]
MILAIDITSGKTIWSRALSAGAL